jgi:vacuolar-type H+-ATPase subunit E/Vma4
MSTNQSFDMETQLIEKTVKERNKILQDAKTKATKIIENAEGEAEKLKRETEMHVRTVVASELRAVTDKIVGESHLQGRKKMMETRQEILESVYMEAEDRLRIIAKDETKVNYSKVLTQLVAEAVTAIGGNEFIIQAKKPDLPYLKDNLDKLGEEIGKVSLTISDAPIDIIGGVLIRNTLGTKIYNNTLDGRFSKLKQELEAEIAQKIGVI